MPEVREHVHAAGEQRPDRLSELPELRLVVGRLAEAQVPERRLGLPVVHADRAPDVGLVPGRVPEVERDAERRVERSQQEREQAVVARLLEDDADDAEPVAEQGRALLERPERPQRPRGHLHREREPGRHGLPPAAKDSSEGSRYPVTFSSTDGSRDA